MTTVIRCRLLWNLCEYISLEDLQGDFVECGVWKGGSAGLMGLALKKFDPDKKRNLLLFDSFEGMPQPCLQDGDAAAQYSGGVNAGELTSVHQCEASLEEVRHFLIDQLQLESARVIFHQGWFQETLPKLGQEPGKIVLLRLDGDWYESTKICLDTLYDRVVMGGVIILDDYYCWEGCKKATDEFLTKRSIVAQLKRIDVDSCYWIK
jgi:hypothetical protein